MNCTLCIYYIASSNLTILFIDFNKIRYISEYNINDKKLQSGNRVPSRDFHEEDLAWVHRQIDIHEQVLGKLKKYEWDAKPVEILKGTQKLIETVSTEEKLSVFDEILNFNLMDNQENKTIQ